MPTMQALTVIFFGFLSIGYVCAGFISRQTEVGDINGKCTYDEDCNTENSFCRNHKKCECKTAFKYDQNSDRCVATELGLTCDADYHCSGIPNSRCVDRTCQCENGHGALNTLKSCIPSKRLMASCNADEECQVNDEFSRCNITTRVCDCMLSYHPAWNTNKCLPNKRLRDMCQSHEECANSPDQQDLVECRQDGSLKRCLCRPGVGQQGNVCTKGYDGGAAQVIVSTLFLVMSLLALSALQ